MSLALAAICRLEKQNKIIKNVRCFFDQFANNNCKNNVLVEQMIILSIKEFL